jgi:hypothetical protein
VLLIGYNSDFYIRFSPCFLFNRQHIRNRYRERVRHSHWDIDSAFLAAVQLEGFGNIRESTLALFCNLILEAAGWSRQFALASPCAISTTRNQTGPGRLKGPRAASFSSAFRQVMLQNSIASPAHAMSLLVIPLRQMPRGPRCSGRLHILFELYQIHVDQTPERRQLFGKFGCGD